MSLSTDRQTPVRSALCGHLLAPLRRLAVRISGLMPGVRAREQAQLQAVRSELEQACRELAARADGPGVALGRSPGEKAVLQAARPRWHRD